jgi:NAD(P)-dependent dehydrogenase (short-subunit alcohol dehydrogenase family)
MTAGALAGRTALVTGGGFAAGRGYARALAAAGASVVVADPFEDAGTETAALIEKDGGAARYYPLDLTAEASYHGAVAFSTHTFGSLDVLVNNPNRYRDTSYTALGDMTVAHWDLTMAVMVRGTMLGCKAAVPERSSTTPRRPPTGCATGSTTARPGARSSP